MEFHKTVASVVRKALHTFHLRKKMYAVLLTSSQT
jgi:hypothetical protein